MSDELRSSREGDDGLGRPVRGRSTEPSVALGKASVVEKQATESGRIDDDGLGRPPKKTTSIEPKTTHEEEDDSEAASPDESPYRVRNFAFLKSSAFWMFAILVVGLVALTVFSQFSSMLVALAMAPGWLQWPIAIIVGCLLIVLGYIVGKLLFFLGRLSKESQLDLGQLSTNGGSDADRKKRLKSYLSEYYSLFDNCSEFSNMHGVERKRVVEKLLGHTETGLDGSAAWIDYFHSDFLNPLDAEAEKRIKMYAKFIAIKTALSPWPFVDILAVVYNSSRMIKDLALIYGRGLERADLFKVTVDVLIAVLLAGNLQRGIEKGEEGIEDLAKEMDQGYTDSAYQPDSEVAESGTEEVFAGVLNLGGSAIASVTKNVLKKGTEGLANWLLMRRIGKRAMTLFRPVRNAS